VVWLFALAVLAMTGLVAFMVRLVVLVAADRRRWRQCRDRLARQAEAPPDRLTDAEEPDHSLELAVDFVQVWLDTQWEQRSG
jgi:hypothetical protein